MFRRLTVLFLAAAGLLAVVALPASAHVTVTSDGATKGGFSVITFRVPNEETDAATVALKVQLPVDHPIAFVSVQPKPGWTVTSTTTKLAKPLQAHGQDITEAVTEVEWTGGKIEPGQFDQFSIQAGPLPTDTDSLTFKAIQTYRDAAGKTQDVAWIQESVPGEAEPDHPAPVLQLASASSDSSTGTASADKDAASTGSDVTVAASSEKAASVTTSSKDSSSSQLNVFAMAFGAAGLLVAIVAMILALAARQKLTMVMQGRGTSGDE